MKNFLIITAGIIAIIVPGLLTVLLLWVLFYPPHREAVSTIINNWKGDFTMCLKKIKGMKSHYDQHLREREDLNNLEIDRSYGEYAAQKYLRYKEKLQSQIVGANSLIVLAFGIGCALVGSVWYVFSYVIPKL
jgi:UPF0716 family protein affecting phage T7 exclusion